MIDVFHANNELIEKITAAENERELIKIVQASLHEYLLASTVQHSELDIAFSVTGGPSNWQDVTCFDVPCTPKPARKSGYGDILVEKASDFVHLATPAGFIPLVDVLPMQAQLKNKRLN